MNKKMSDTAVREKRGMKECMDLLLALPAPEKDHELLEDINAAFAGLSDEEINNMIVVNAALIKAAKSGNVSAVKELRSIIRDDERSRKELEKILGNNTSRAGSYIGIPALFVAPPFVSVLADISGNMHSEYILPGGRGSGKSSFVSLAVIDLIMRNPGLHACVLRQVEKTVRDSVYSQIMWAVSKLGLEESFSATLSPLEIVRRETGQKIFFRGADKPEKIKSIKPGFGYIGILWFEELDQFRGAEAVRKIEQSVIRGGNTAYNFKTFNPPRSASNWANKYICERGEGSLVMKSTYLDVPESWLGRPFIDDAELLKKQNPSAYENEYLGKANGNGGNVFDNVVLRNISEDEINTFGNIIHGVDWGWYPDPFAYVSAAYDAARRRLFIFREYRCNKKSNRETADVLINEFGVTPSDIVFCDSAEKKSVSDYRSFGISARPAEKGPGSVDYSMKWLQSLSEIIIDPAACPKTAAEFVEYEYERTKEGEIITGYPDKNNHSIDAVRYAASLIWRKKGK